VLIGSRSLLTIFKTRFSIFRSSVLVIAFSRQEGTQMMTVVSAHGKPLSAAPRLPTRVIHDTARSLQQIGAYSTPSSHDAHTSRAPRPPGWRETDLARRQGRRSRARQAVTHQARRLPQSTPAGTPRRTVIGPINNRVSCELPCAIK
jgi:hypothetical protein